MPLAKVGKLARGAERWALEKQQMSEAAVLRQAGIGAGQQRAVLLGVEVADFGGEVARAGEVALGKARAEAPGDDLVVAGFWGGLIAIRRRGDEIELEA